MDRPRESGREPGVNAGSAGCRCDILCGGQQTQCAARGHAQGDAGERSGCIYDDPIFLDTAQVTAAFNGNTDPIGYRKGRGTGEDTRGKASLNAGVWYVHKFGMHRRRYLAPCQTGGDVTVTRDGDPPYPHTGAFGINIHRGGYATTSSLGCQTIHPSQWEGFIGLMKDQTIRYAGNAGRAESFPTYCRSVDVPPAAPG